MYEKKYALLGAGVLLGIAVACSSPTPTAPDAAGSMTSAGAGPGGATLKIAAPALQSPTGGKTLEDYEFVLSNVSGTYSTFPVTYRLVIKSATGSTVKTATFSASKGATTSYVLSGAALDFDKLYTWQARAEYNGAHGPWSDAATFRSPAGGYMRGNEIFDPLTNGETVGQVHGPVKFIDGEGAHMSSQNARISYRLPENLQEGEFSIVAQGVDEGNPGVKAKVISMSEGDVDVTANDYRATLEVRGRDYLTAPGTVSMRMITGDAENSGRIHDTSRRVKSWTRAETYFFKMYWSSTRAGYEIRIGGPSGPLFDAASTALDGHPYRPVPHYVHIGSPPARSGGNATHPNMTVRNLWVSSRPRPTFPGIIGRPE